MAEAANSDVTCPVCGSDNVRPSQRRSTFESFRVWRGQQRYRCRSCRRSFHAAVPDEAIAELRASERARRKRSRAWRSFIQSRNSRRTMEILLFLGMLIVFYWAFNSLVKKAGSGVGGAPVQTQ